MDSGGEFISILIVVVIWEHCIPKTKYLKPILLQATVTMINNYKSAKVLYLS